MNYFKIASLLFVVTFLVGTSHASQAALTHAEQKVESLEFETGKYSFVIHPDLVETSDVKQTIEPIEFDIDDNLFVIHPDAIHIYNKYEAFLAPAEPERENIIGNFGFDKIGTIYDKNNSYKKLTGEAYQKALATMQDSYWLGKIVEKGLAQPFKEIVNQCDININTLTISKIPYLTYAIINHKSELIEMLIDLHADINHTYCNITPAAFAICTNQPVAMKRLLLAGANIMAPDCHVFDKLNQTSPYKEIISEIYFAREAEQMKLPRKIFLTNGVGNEKGLARKIIEYLLGKNHKVMSMSACRKALESNNSKVD